MALLDVVDAPGRAAAAGRQSSSRRARRADVRGSAGVFPQRVLPYALVLPQLVVVGIFFLWPALRAFREAFVESNAFGIGERFAGLQNFASGVFVSSYAHAAEVTLVLAAITTAGSMALGLLLAVQVERVASGRSIYRTLFLLTYAIPGAVAGALWLFIFEPGIGPGARLLDALGAHWNAALNPTQALLLVAAIGIWQQSGFCFLFFTAGLQAIPREYHEAGAMDGASPTRSFWSITMPLLSPVTFYLVVMNVVYAVFGLFGIIDIVTQGGPGFATTTLVYRLYVDAFQNADTTVAGAESIVLLAVVAGFTALQFRALRRRIHYR